MPERGARRWAFGPALFLSGRSFRPTTNHRAWVSHWREAARATRRPSSSQGAVRFFLVSLGERCIEAWAWAMQTGS